MENEWLNLGETAEILGVHPATVRAWGDKGDLPMQRTPGGHRRFRRIDVQARAALDQAQQTGANIVMQNMYGRARIAFNDGSLSGETWYRQLGPEARREHGEIGRHLLDSVTQYLSGQQPEDEVLLEAQATGQAYERLGYDNHLSLTETTSAYLYFREFLSQTVYDIAHAAGSQGPTDWREIRRQVICLTNEVLLGIIAAHEERLNE